VCHQHILPIFFLFLGSLVKSWYLIRGSRRRYWWLCITGWCYWY